MSGSLQYIVDDAGNSVNITISGRFDENAKLAPLLSQIGKHQQVRFDLGGVAAITSVGVREWHRFISAIPRAVHVELDKCSPPFVTQMNMIRGFAGTGRVLSVYAPFVCESCGHSDTVLVQVADGAKPSVEAPTCSTCNDTMIFDEIEQTYFRFAGV